MAGRAPAERPEHQGDAGPPGHLVDAGRPRADPGDHVEGIADRPGRGRPPARREPPATPADRRGGPPDRRGLPGIGRAGPERARRGSVDGLAGPPGRRVRPGDGRLIGPDAPDRPSRAVGPVGGADRPRGVDAQRGLGPPLSSPGRPSEGAILPPAPRRLRPGRRAVPPADGPGGDDPGDRFRLPGIPPPGAEGILSRRTNPFLAAQCLHEHALRRGDAPPARDGRPGRLVARGDGRSAPGDVPRPGGGGDDRPGREPEGVSPGGLGRGGGLPDDPLDLPPRRDPLRGRPLVLLPRRPDLGRRLGLGSPRRPRDVLGGRRRGSPEGRWAASTPG